MTIRPARPEDLGAIEQCAADAYEKYVARIGRNPAPMIADFKTQIDQGVVHVSVPDHKSANGEIRGFVVFYAKGDRVHLENVAVSVRYHGMGLGKGLIAHCENYARTNGFSAVELYTNEKMTENLVLYPRLGYHETGRRTEDGFSRVYFKKQVLAAR